MRYYLRTHAAIHLAAAVTTRRRLGSDLVFACRDAELAVAAVREHLEVTRV